MKIEPKKAVGSLNLGMIPEDYERVLGPVKDAFKRTRSSQDTILAYDQHCLHLTVDQTGVLKAITVFRPEQVELEGVRLLGRSLEEVKYELDGISFQFESCDAGLWSEAAGITIIETDGLVDGVEVTGVSQEH